MAASIPLRPVQWPKSAKTCCLNAAGTFVLNRAFLKKDGFCYGLVVFLWGEKRKPLCKCFEKHSFFVA